MQNTRVFAGEYLAGNLTPLTTLKCLKVCMMANEGHFRVEKRRAFRVGDIVLEEVGVFYRVTIRVYCGQNDFVDEKQAPSPSRTWCCWKVMLASAGIAE